MSVEAFKYMQDRPGFCTCLFIEVMTYCTYRGRHKKIHVKNDNSIHSVSVQGYIWTGLVASGIMCQPNILLQVKSNISWKKLLESASSDCFNRRATLEKPACCLRTDSSFTSAFISCFDILCCVVNAHCIAQIAKGLM